MNFKYAFVVLAASVAAQQGQYASQAQTAHEANQAQRSQNIDQVQQNQPRQQYYSSQYNNYQNNNQQQYQPTGNASAYHQDRVDNRQQRASTVSSFVMANGGPGAVPTDVRRDAISSVYGSVSNQNDQRRQQVSSYIATGTMRDNASAYHQDKVDNRQERASSVSSFVMANGGPGSVPTDVRRAAISSAYAANPDQKRQQVSSFMATQTQINTASVAQAVSSYAATATSKPTKSSFWDKLKIKKTATPTDGSNNSAGTTATAKPGMGKGFKDFFKKIQVKAQKSSSVAAEPSATATA